jgi:hypothetical protein
MSEDASESDLTVTPFFDDPITDIHPAIGVVDDVAYVGVWVPCMVTDKEGHSASRDFLYLITSAREKILCTSQELAKRHWRLAYKPVHFTNRWSLQHVQEYVSGGGVDAAKLFVNILDLYEEFIEMPDARFYLFHTLWSVGTYFHHLFNSFPYPYIGGVKRSGKSKTETVHFCLDFNAVFSNNMSVSSLYRMIQNSRTTLLIDETEKLSNPNRAMEFRNILLSGYKKGAKTFRVEKGPKDRLEPEEFEVYSGKMLANISGLEDVLEDRCIPQYQKRSVDKTIANREVDISDARYEGFRDLLCRLFLCHWNEVKEIYAEISRCSELSALCECLKIQKGNEEDGSQYLSSRELELWKPILSLARFFDKRLQPSELRAHYEAVKTNPPPPNLTQELVFTTTQPSLSSLMFGLACTLAKERHIENVTEAGEEILVACLPNLVSPGQDHDWVKVRDIKEEMSKQFEETQDWLTSRWIGSALRRLGFLNKRRVGTGYEYDVPSERLEDLKRRMQIEEPSGSPEKEQKTLEEPKSSGPSSTPLSSGEMLQLLRNKLPPGQAFFEADAIKIMTDHNWPREQADNLLRDLKERGAIGMTPEGAWQWV